jgi:Mrp family chromosome partitioning ATPase
MNRVKRIGRKYEKMKPGIDRVRAANATIRRTNKLRRGKAGRMVTYGEPGQGKSFYTPHTEASLSTMSKPELIHLGKLLGVKGLSRLKKEYIIRDILSFQEKQVVADD